MYVCLSVHDPRRAQRSTNQANTILASRGEHPGLMISPAPRGCRKGICCPYEHYDLYALWPKSWPTMPLSCLSYLYEVLYSMTARISQLEVKSPHCTSSFGVCLSHCKAEGLAPTPAAPLSLPLPGVSSRTQGEPRRPPLSQVWTLMPRRFPWERAEVAVGSAGRGPKQEHD